jgi:thiol:disulfide interchange protein DsbD
MRIRLTAIFALLLCLVNASDAQILEPAHWKFKATDEGADIVKITATATIDKGWHIYALEASADPNAMGPIPTSLVLKASKDFELSGKPQQGKYITHFDPNFSLDLNYFENSAVFSQKIKTKNAGEFKLEGVIEFMACDEEKCIFPDPVNFELVIHPGAKSDAAVSEKIDSSLVQTTDTSQAVKQTISADDDPLRLEAVDLNSPVHACGQEKEETTLWMIFLFGLVGGLLAMVTPCVFPMIPLTVSFFTKQKGGTKGKIQASVYGLFIVLVYFLLSLPFHLSKNISPEVLNELATNMWINLAFFIIFVVFAISFFGYYELTLPSGLANKVDNASNIGGWIGIFFMALTLVIVSFSCTGPILGSVIGSIYAADAMGTVNFVGLELSLPASKISVAMLGFGIALGLPFALFAMFPSMLKKLPKSGGWLEDFKVSLGFLEVGLALKFLSQADLVEQWGILKREVFFAIWIVICVFWTLYMFGIFRFKKGQGTKSMSKFKMAFTIAILLLTIRLIPGILPQSSLNKFHFLSGFPPPTTYSLYPAKEEFRIYKDLDEAIAVAKAENKPIFIDFTGWACVNCRKMEENVWPTDRVHPLLNEYVMCSLYVDERTELPADKQFTYVTRDGRQKSIRTIGNKWSTLQTETFNNNTQPFYALITPDGNLLTPPTSGLQDADQYADWLACGVNAFETSSN